MGIVPDGPMRCKAQPVSLATCAGKVTNPLLVWQLQAIYTARCMNLKHVPHTGTRGNK